MNEYHDWQYNGVAPFNKILDWCKLHLRSSDYDYLGWETIRFYDTAAYTFFTMRWM